MKYIDRKAIALERFFASHSDMLSHLDDFSEEDLREAANDLFPLKKNTLSVIICDCLKLLRSRYDISGYICDDLLNASDLPVKEFIDKGYFGKFLLWLRELHIKNALDRTPWESSVKTAACLLKPLEGSFLRSFFSLSNQRVFISADGDTITVTPAEREWGRVSISFLGCSYDTIPSLPLPGFCVATEADTDNGNARLSMLVDTLFSNTHSSLADRLLSDEGWQTVIFAYNDAVLNVSFTDYAEQMRLRGISKADAVFECCRILLNKHLLMGNDGLNHEERILMPAAGLIGALHAVYLKQTIDFAIWQYDEIIRSNISNRYDMQTFIASLKKCSCDDLADILTKAVQASFDDLDREAMRCAKMFSALLHKKLEDGTARPLFYWLYDKFCHASSLNTDKTAKTQAEQIILNKIDDCITPEMTELGYTGEYPDYWRIRTYSATKKRMEYVSFSLNRHSNRLIRGVESYYVTVYAGVLDGKRADEYEQFGVMHDRTSVFDCVAEKTPFSRYGEICNDNYDGPALFDLDHYDGDTVELIHEESAKLVSIMPIIEHQFEHGYLPSDYRKRFSFFSAAGAFIRSFSYFLPLMIVLATVLLAAYLLFGKYLPVTSLSGTAVSVAILLLSFFITCIASTVRCFICSKKLWYY